MDIKMGAKMSDQEFVHTGSGVDYCANNMLFNTPEVMELQKKLREYKYATTAKERQEVQFWIESLIMRAMAKQTEKVATIFIEHIKEG